MYDRYVKLRDAIGLTDAQVAREVGLNSQIFYDWKSGKGKPKADKLQKLAKYFNVSIEYFLEAHG